MTYVSSRAKASTYETTADSKEDIFDLDQALDTDGRALAFGLEACTQRNTAVVWDKFSKGWCRVDGKKYRVIRTTGRFYGPFPIGIARE